MDGNMVHIREECCDAKQQGIRQRLILLSHGGRPIQISSLLVWSLYLDEYMNSESGSTDAITY